MVGIDRMAHHVVDVVRLNAQRHELRLEELAQAVNVEIIAFAIVESQQTGFEVQAVDKLVDLSLINRLHDLRP